MKTISTLFLAAAFLLARPAFAGDEAAKEAPKAEKKDKKAASEKKEAPAGEKKEEKKADKGSW
jgi:hypothetical protein